MCDQCNDLQSQVDELRKDLMMVIRSDPKFSDMFCSWCNERAATTRTYKDDLEPGNIAKWYIVSVPLCETHAVKWDEKQAAKDTLTGEES